MSSIKTIVIGNLPVGFVIEFSNGYGASVMWGPLSKCSAYAQQESAHQIVREVSSPDVEIGLLQHGEMLRLADNRKLAVLDQIPPDKLVAVLTSLAKHPEHLLADMEASLEVAP